MTTIEKWTPMHRWRAWDTDWLLVGEWSERPLVESLPEGGALTVDYPTGLRDCWRVVDRRLIPEPTVGMWNLSTFGDIDESSWECFEPNAWDYMAQIAVDAGFADFASWAQGMASLNRRVLR
ncbi:hypothetical protein [Nocardia aurea]|jgi:hypothetical protein|uniref:hypothetical protein n=1 Tax=Nocardia aurea TaxID=2144174 RepID=UPI0033AF2F57